MLPLRECEGRTVDIELEVAEEIVERGRGMYSSLSENPTRGRGWAFGGEWLSDTLVDVSPSIEARGSEGCDVALSSDGSSCLLMSESAGVAGALPVLREARSEGLITEDRSWWEMAPERRCAWPRLRPPIEGGGKTFSPLVGLELIKPGP